MIPDQDPDLLSSSPVTGTRSVRRSILGALLVGLITTGAAGASCVGQSFNRRQANALEGIQRRLETMPIVPMTPCPAPPKEVQR